MAFTAAMEHVDRTFLLTAAMTLFLAAVGWISIRKLFSFFSLAPRGISQSSTGTRGEIEDFTGDAFHQYRKSRFEIIDADSRQDGDRRVQIQQVQGFSFEQEVLGLSSMFSRLSLVDSNVCSSVASDNTRRRSVRSNIDRVVDLLADKFNAMTLVDVEWPLESIVIDYSCVPDVRKRIAQKNVRRMLKVRDRKRMLEEDAQRQEAIRAEEESRRIRAEEIEKQRCVQMKIDWLTREMEMKKTTSGCQLLRCRAQRKYVGNQNSLRIALLKVQSREPWARRGLLRFDC